MKKKSKNQKFKKVLASFKKPLVIALTISIAINLGLVGYLIWNNQNKNSSEALWIKRGLGCERPTLNLQNTDIFCNDKFYKNPVVTRDLTYTYLGCEYVLSDRSKDDIEITEYEEDDGNVVDQAKEREKDLKALEQTRQTCKSNDLLDTKAKDIAAELNKKIGKDIVH